MKVRVNNQKQAKHYKHPLAHDVSTTLEFGHIQPIMVAECIGNSKNTLRVGQICRMMPMIQPTFGRLTVNTYNVFVPIESIYHPYGSFRAGQSYLGASARYIPNKVITTSAGFWYMVCKYMSTVTVLGIGNNSTSYSYGIEIPGTDVTYINSIDAQEALQAWSESFATYLPMSWFSTYFSEYFSLDTSSSESEAKSFGRYDWIEKVDGQSQSYLICGRFHESAKALRKVLYGCGFKLLNDFQDVSMLPLLAYYKAYFDLFYPKRDKTWKDCACAGLQEWCEQNGNFDATKSTGYLGSYPALMFDFVYDLCTTYYTQSPDFVSAHISGQRITNVAWESFKTMTPDSQDSYVSTVGGTIGDSTQVIVSTSANPSSASNNITSRLLSAQNLDLLQRVYHRINAKTAIGADIREYLKTQLGVDYLDEDDSYWIGSHKMDLNISPVFSNADTEGANLGEFAAQGSGAAQGEVLSYEAKVDGYWICMVTVVPDSRFAQGMDMKLQHVKKNDFYDPIYDSMTLLPTRRKYVFAEQQYSSVDYDTLDSEPMNSSFGNIPNYIEYCTKQNIVNGDMSLMSKRATYLPFTLDKLLPYTGYYVQDGKYVIANTPYNTVVNGSIWRYIGLYKWMGNFNRIFENSGTEQGTVTALGLYNNMFYGIGFDDNFVLHNYLDFTQWNSKLPVSDAFQTGAFEGASVKVEKA